MTNPLKTLLEQWTEVEDLIAVSSLASWDQEVVMPARGAAGRAAVMGTLAGLKHKALVNPKLADALLAVEDEADSSSVAGAHAREARRQVDRARNVPEALVREYAVLCAEAHESWKGARKASDFAAFAPHLGRLLELSKEMASHYPGTGSAYDRLLDIYEPGAREADLAPLFDSLESELVPWIHAVASSGVVVDETPALGELTSDGQLAFAREVAVAMGFDFQAGRIDKAAHPFCSGFSPGDVRITWRTLENDFRSSLFGVVHEAGHGLYEQGLPEEWARTPISGAASLGVHESQSRLWENLVCRSRGFWEWALPRFQAHFPEKQSVKIDDLWRTLHTVKPSFIRVEADEGTYDLHVMIRFQIERALFNGELDVRDVSGAWDDAYERSLGIRPKNAAEGVLQDIHWSSGAFGYFPTYTLGNLLAAQLFEAAESELGELEPQFARGEFKPLLGWLRTNVHSHASRLPVAELVQQATGKGLNPDAYLARRRRLLSEVYGVS